PRNAPESIISRFSDTGKYRVPVVVEFDASRAGNYKTTPVLYQGMLSKMTCPPSFARELKKIFPPESQDFWQLRYT
ncbi:MAG: hypothetical protein AABZ57_00270, partial [Candidatus Margulisiibacteriota bacterium]